VNNRQERKEGTTKKYRELLKEASLCVHCENLSLYFAFKFSEEQTNSGPFFVNIPYHCTRISTINRYTRTIFMKNLFITTLILGIFFTSCKKEIKDLPPATDNGSNTFGAKVNGNLWKPQGFGPFPANDILESTVAGNDIQIWARNFASSPNETEFYLLIKNVTGPGTYQLNENIPAHPYPDVSYGYYVKRNITPQNEWSTSASYTGTVTITKFDRTNRIASGSFQFNAINMYNTPEPLTVTEGRFDVKYQ
jgi:hypothetical protein